MIHANSLLEEYLHTLQQRYLTNISPITNLKQNMEQALIDTRNDKLAKEAEKL